LLLTKTASVEGLLKIARSLPKPIKKTIVSWSVNAPVVAERYEGIAASPLDRLIAARLCQEAGYWVRLRIDPLIPVENWRGEYEKLIRMIGEYVKPECVTLGSLRFLPRTAAIVTARAPELVKYTENFSSGRWRIPLSQRVEMYSFLSGLLKEIGVESVSLCKETEEFRRMVGLAGPCHCEIDDYGLRM
jgi:spore photoproduct lyase